MKATGAIALAGGSGQPTRPLFLDARTIPRAVMSQGLSPATGAGFIQRRAGPQDLSGVDDAPRQW